MLAVLLTGLEALYEGLIFIWVAQQVVDSSIGFRDGAAQGVSMLVVQVQRCSSASGFPVVAMDVDCLGVTFR